MAVSRVSLCRFGSTFSPTISYYFTNHLSSFRTSPPQIRSFAAAAAAASLSAENSASYVDVATPKTTPRRKHMCLYFTQGKCTKMDDPTHTHTFSHGFSEDLKVNIVELKKVRPQQLDYFLVLDLEGKVEILEFPVLMIDAKTLYVVDFFHRFVRPCKMSEQRINQYIEGKYGKFGVDRVWHDTAIPFEEVIQQFEDWMAKHQLWGNEFGGRRPLNRAAFVTCGNWDVKTKVPEQCKVSQMNLPAYFMEWINLKDVYLNFYKRKATGMMTMMRELQMPLVGSHHLGIDDTKNITRVLQRMIIDGAVLQITARRHSDSPEKVQFLFENRIR